MQVQRHTLTHREVWRRPDAAGATDYTTNTAKADAQAKSPSAQPDFIRTLRVATSTWTSTASVTVTVTGTDRFGTTITEDLVIVAAGTTVDGSKPFATITSVSWTTPAGWSAGTFKVQSGTKLGLHLPALALNVTATKEIGLDETASPPNPANATAGTVDATYLTYAPTTTVTAANGIEAYFTYTLFQDLIP